MKMIGAVAMLLVALSVYSESSAEVSIGGFSVDGRRVGGVNFPSGESFGPVHHRTEIQGRGNIFITDVDEGSFDEVPESRIRFDNPPIISTAKESAAGKGFASITAKRLLEQSEKSDE